MKVEKIPSGTRVFVWRSSLGTPHLSPTPLCTRSVMTFFKTDAQKDAMVAISAEDNMEGDGYLWKIGPDDREKFGITDPSFIKAAYCDYLGADLQVVPKSGSTGFFLACIGAGAALSALSTNKRTTTHQSERTIQ